MRDFAGLKVWQRAHALSVAVHAGARGMRRREHANLRSQLTRAAESIPTNIVEGCGALTASEFARFLGIAIKSASETEYHLIAARDRAALPHADAVSLCAEVVEIRRMLFALRTKVLRDR